MKPRFFPQPVRERADECPDEMLILNGSTPKQLRRTLLEHHLNAFVALTGRPRRLVARQIRALVVTFSGLGDFIPDDVWRKVYRVQAIGTEPPLSKSIP